MGKAVARRVGRKELEAIRRDFGLSYAELARLFCVSRPAVQGWYQHDVPVTRAADVDRVRELAEVFLRKFIPARVPQIVRTPGKGLGGKTVLEVVGAAGVEPVYAYLESLFAYNSR